MCEVASIRPWIAVPGPICPPLCAPWRSRRDTKGHNRLSLSQVRAKFGLSTNTSDSVLSDLREAAAGGRKATTVPEMDKASQTLARALTAIDPDNLASVLRAVKQGVDKANLVQFAQILQNEAGAGDERVSMEPIDHTIFNRMTRNDTILISDVASRYAHRLRNLTVDAETNGVTKSLLDGTSKDPTGGATHFHSPKYQPHLGESVTGRDLGGGLESVLRVVDGNRKSIPNYRPGFNVIFPQVPVPSVPEHIAKFYRDPGNGHVR
jgi:hypothetical protein